MLMSDVPDKATRWRNVAIALALGALAMLFYLMTMVRIQP
jgi:hypothetical protein